jgi:hypothetical protein
MAAGIQEMAVPEVAVKGAGAIVVEANPTAPAEVARVAAAQAEPPRVLPAMPVAMDPAVVMEAQVASVEPEELVAVQAASAEVWVARAEA